ncbi:MAG: hypothetical protein CME63_01300 [Halobacteriovoraceae bacterium]|nr:hypothetical protein [Halobacteriovoraceae bacterium]|tara:strand:+ start:908 stop:1837 length:930 start_codon:yes stop_codon:yes gene_type:complete
MKPALFTTIILAAVSINSQASLVDRLIQRLSQDIYTDGHGVGLPVKVGETEVGKKYRQSFVKLNGITSFVDGLGLTQYENNNIGLLLVKEGNTEEPAFNTISETAGYDKFTDWKNGTEFLKVLRKYTKENGCIPKITSLSHGWASDRRGEGKGLTGDKGLNGIYASMVDLPRSIGKFGTKTISKDLKSEVAKGNIKFCSYCVAQFYACNISAKFAREFTEVSGCQAAVATGQNSPQFQSFESKVERQKVFSGAHYWKSAAGVWAERYTNEQRENGERLGSWYRSTPIKNTQGKVISISEENLGETYISL